MLKLLKFLVTLVVLISLQANAQEASAKQNNVTAIDIAIEPDEKMVKFAKAANARLLKVYPRGFGLEPSHKPHITLVQGYVRTAELDKVYTAVGKILIKEHVANWKLKATQYYYFPWQGAGIAAIQIESSDKLLALQQKLLDAISPYTEKTGTAAAFVTSAEEPEINLQTIDYVNKFIQYASGKHFNPHVTIGLAPVDYLKEMLNEPFAEFTFSPKDISIFQLGNFGTARNKLKELELKR